MAGIKTEITLKDGVTPILNRITKRLSNLEKSTKKLTVTLDSFNFAVKEIPKSQEKIILQQGRIKRSIDNTQAAQYRCIRAENLMKQSVTGVAIKQEQLTQATHRTWQNQERTKQSIEKTSQAQERTKQSVEKTNQSRQKSLQAAEKTKQATQKTVVGEEKIKQATEGTKQAKSKTLIFAQRLLQAITGTAIKEESLKQASERTKQSVQKTLQARQKTSQEVHKTAIAQSKVAEQTQKTAYASQRVDTEKRRGLLVTAREAFMQKKIEWQTIRNKQAQDKYNRSIQQGANSANMLWNKLKTAAGMYFGAQTVGSIINTSDSLTMAKARMNVVSDGVHSSDELMNMIYGASMRSRSGYLDMAASVSKVAMQAGSLFRTDGKQNNAAIVQFMENYNKMAAISGATAQQTSAAMLQIVQSLSSGELRGDELRSVLENMPVVADYIAKKMGVARDQILSLGHDGKISAEVLRDAVMGATDDLNEKMKKIPYTWGQVWTIFKNAAIKAFEPVLNGISAILKNEKFLEFANAMGRALVVAGRLAYPVFNALGSIIGWVYDKLKAMYNFVKDNISIIAPIFIGIASALALYYSWVGAVCLITKTWAAVQAVLNAVMAMTPLMWIVLAIGAVIAAVYLLVDAGTSGTGVLVGAAYWLWEVICNIGKWIANMFCGIVQEIVNRWNWMCDNTAIIFDNIGTFWDNLWINCRIGLNNFVSWAIGKLASLAESVSPIAEALGVDVSGLRKVANKAASKADSLERNKGSYKSLIPWSERGTVDWEKYKYGDLSDAYDRGYKVGADFENSVKEKFKGLEEYFGGEEQNDFYKALTGGFDNPATGNPTLDKISGDTGDIAKNTGKSEEDFSYLRELAEREAINKYTLTDLKIDMTNNNNISNGVDSDNLMQRLAKQLSEAVLSTAEGITPW